MRYLAFLSDCRKDPLGVVCGVGIFGGLAWLALPLAFGAIGLLAGCAINLNEIRATTVKVAEGFGHGSGTFVGPDTILTAAHVVAPEGPLELEFPDGTKAPAKVTWADDTSDLALLKSDQKVKDWSPVSCEQLKLGDRVFTFGNPGFLRFVYTEGVVAGVDTMGAQQAMLPPGMPVSIQPMLVVSANWEPGDSGSAVFDSHGRVRGVVSIVFNIDGSRTNNALITPVTMLPECKGSAA